MYKKPNSAECTAPVLEQRSHRWGFPLSREEVVMEQLRAGTPRKELEGDFSQLSQQALDYAEILVRLPKPPGRPRKALALKRG